MDLHRSDADPHANPIPSFTHVGIMGEKYTFILGSASFCFSFLTNGKGVMILSIFVSMLKFLKGEIPDPQHCK